MSKQIAESGEMNPSYNMLMKLAALYGVTMDFLLGIERGRYVKIDGLTESRAALVTRLIEELRTES